MTMKVYTLLVSAVMVASPDFFSIFLYLQTFSFVGALVDERKNEPLSLANAKRENLRMAQFPIDKYLNWCQGSKLLPINQVNLTIENLRSMGGKSLRVIS